MADQPTLRTLLSAIYQVVAQAEAIKALEEPGSSYDVAEKVSRDSALLSEDVRDEIKALEKWGESGDAA